MAIFPALQKLTHMWCFPETIMGLGDQVGQRDSSTLLIYQASSILRQGKNQCLQARQPNAYCWLCSADMHTLCHSRPISDIRLQP